MFFGVEGGVWEQGIGEKLHVFLGEERGVWEEGIGKKLRVNEWIVVVGVVVERVEVVGVVVVEWVEVVGVVVESEDR